MFKMLHTLGAFSITVYDDMYAEPESVLVTIFLPHPTYRFNLSQKCLIDIYAVVSRWVETTLYVPSDLFVCGNISMKPFNDNYDFAPTHSKQFQ